MLDSEHIIQERVVSDASDRGRRFEDTNLEIVRVSDVVVCLIREGADAKPGGTAGFRDMAVNRQVPTLVIHVGIKDGRPAFREEWPTLGNDGRLEDEQRLSRDSSPRLALKLPCELGHLPAPSLEPSEFWKDHGYFETVRRRASDLAKRHRVLFTVAALLIIVFHVAATILATSVIVFHTKMALSWVETLLSFEAILLIAGLYIHNRLHHSRTAEAWARSRLVTEILRSLKAIDPRHVYLGQFFQEPRPAELRTLLRTLSVLHLRATKSREQSDAAWQEHREKYLAERVEGQIEFYSKKLNSARFWSGACNLVFLEAALLAWAATMLKLTLFFAEDFRWVIHVDEGLREVLGLFAVVLPAVAIAALSWTSANEFDSRARTFSAARNFLRRQKVLITRSRSLAEFEKLMLGTETVLLGENVTWYTRRTFTQAT